MNTPLIIMHLSLTLIYFFRPQCRLLCHFTGSYKLVSGRVLWWKFLMHPEAIFAGLFVNKRHQHTLFITIERVSGFCSPLNQVTLESGIA